MKKKSLLSAMIVAMLFATVLTFGQQPQYRNLPIYRWLSGNAAPDNLDTNALDVSTINNDTTDIAWGGWDTASVASTYAMWWVKDYDGTYELEATGYYDSGDHVTDQWLVSPYFSTNKFNGVTFSFSSECAKYAGAPIVAMISTNYKGGSPATATWDTIPGLNIPSPNGTASSGWEQSGSASLDAAMYKGDSVCVAFHYTSTSGAAATYYVDSVQITGNLAAIRNINDNGKFSIYPNPVASTVTISNSTDKIKNIEIYNMVGELVAAYQNVDNNKYLINLGNLQQGMYFTKVLLMNGTVISNKIVKE
jgi:hypothetical protein